MTSIQKPISRAAEKQQRHRDKERVWQQLRRLVLHRDKHTCRACGFREGVDVHHIKMRSAGGDDSTANCAALCRVCHAEIHAYRLFLVGKDANKSLRVERHT